MKKTDLAEQHRKSDSQVGDIDSYLGYWLRFVSNQVSASFQTKLSKKGASVAEWIVLRFLLSNAPCSLTKLAQEMGLDKGAVSRLAERLEQRGLILRSVNSEDRRLFSIELTEQGLSLVPELAQIADENDRAFFGHLSKEEIASVTNLLKDIVNRHGFRAKPIS